MMETPDTAEHFLDLIKRSRLRKFMVYIGMGTSEDKPIVMSVSHSDAAPQREKKLLMMETPDTAEHFLDLIKRSRLGKFKVYIGMGTGEGKPIVMSVSRSAAARKKIINDGDARYRRTFFRFDQKIKAGEI